MRADRHPHEAARLAALHAYDILDSPPESEFDDLVNLASRLCETPVALVTLLDHDRQWFKAAVGVDIPERLYEESLCSHAILGRGLIEVPDLTLDSRFADNAVVAGPPHLRFYAGVPLETPEGLPIGTFCVIDVMPRCLTDLQRDALRVLGRQAMTQMELRRRVREGEEERRTVEETLEQAEIATWRVDTSTGLVSGNPLAERFYGVQGDAPKAEVDHAIHPHDRERRAKAFEAFLRGEPYEVEYRTTGSDGVERWLLARGKATQAIHGGSRCLNGVSIDITERRHAEIALTTTQAETDETLEFAGVATWAWDAGSDHVRTNRLLRHFFGIPAHEVGELPLFEFLKAIHPQDRERVSSEIAESLKGAPFETEYRVIDLESVERWVLARGRLLGDSNTLAGVLVDVTARKQAEAALEAERRQFRRLLDEVPAHVVTMQGPELRYDFANRAFLRFLGREANFLGMRIDEAWPVPPEHVAMLRRVYETGESTTGSEVPVADGLFDFLFQALREPDGSISGVFVHSLDVSERVQAQQALRQSEERFRVAQEMTPDAFSILETVRDREGIPVDFRWEYLNAAAVRMAGRPREVLLGGCLRQIGHWSNEIGVFEDLVRVVETGEPCSREMPFDNGDRQGFVRMTAVKVGDGVAASFADITDRRRAEEQLREAVAERTKELRESVDEAERFNYSISHDLRTPLRAIAATSQMLIEEAGPKLTGEHRELLERQDHNARRLGLLIDQLLRLSRLGRVAMVRAPLDLSAIVRSVAEELVLAGESRAIEIQEGMAGEGDPALVRLVFGNLLENACKFSPRDCKVRVRQEDGVVSVADEGIGFDMQYAPKIFLPFERLVSDGEFPGTGIGLANVERIVRRHGGRIWAESEPGKGSTFRFTLG